MKTLNENAAAPIAELDDEVLEGVNGGVAIGEVVRCKSFIVQYCKGCCGYRTSVIETSIL